MSLLENEKVLCKNGPQNIIEVEIGSIVKTKLGNQKVTGFYKKKEDGFKLIFSDGFKVVVGKSTQLKNYNGDFIQVAKLTEGESFNIGDGNKITLIDITPLGKDTFYKLKVDEADHYILENGLVSK